MSEFDWKGQVVVITGASGGIGAVLAHEVARRGGSLVLAARRTAELESVAASTRAQCAVVTADVTRRDEVKRILAAAVGRFGHVDVWVNNAGRGITRLVEALTDDDVDAMIAVNLKSALYGVQTVLPHFKQRGRGHILNVSSVLARAPFTSVRSAYSAAKHALNSITENLAMDLRREFPEIRVATVMPGVVTTNFGLNALGGGADSRTLPGAQRPEEVAAVIADAIEKGRRGDVYTRPEAIERVVAYLRDLAAGK